MSNLFTAAERENILYHLGLPSSGKTAYSYGGVKASETFSTVITSLENVSETGRQRALDIIGSMELIETRKRELSGSSEFSSVGDLQRRSDALDDLNRQYNDWRERLATHLLGPHGLRMISGAVGSNPLNGTWSR